MVNDVRTRVPGGPVVVPQQVETPAVQQPVVRQSPATQQPAVADPARARVTDDSGMRPQAPVIGTVAQAQIDGPNANAGVQVRNGTAQLEVTWREATPEDTSLIAFLRTLPREGPVNARDSRRLERELALAAQRPGGLTAFAVLYEAALSADPPGTPRPRNLDRIVASLQPAEVRRQAEARLHPTTETRPPEPPLVPAQGLAEFRETHPTADLALLLMYPAPRPHSRDAATRRQEQEAYDHWRASVQTAEQRINDPHVVSELRGWAARADVSRALRQIGIDEAQLGAYLAAGGDLSRLPETPPSRIAVAQQSARNGDGNGMLAIAGVLHLRETVARARLHELDDRIAQLGRDINANPPRRAELSPQLEAALEERRLVAANLSNATSVLGRTRTSFQQARDQALQAEADRLRGVLDHQPTQAQLDRYNALDNRAAELATMTPPQRLPAGERRELMTLRRTVSAYWNAERRIRTLEPQLRRRAEHYENAIERYMRQHHCTLEQVPDSIRNAAQDMDDSLGATIATASQHPTYAGQEDATPTPEQTRARVGNDPTITAATNPTFHPNQADAQPTAQQVLARAQQLNDIQMRRPPRTTPPETTNDPSRRAQLDARDARDERHHRAVSVRHRVYRQAARADVQERNLHVGDVQSRPTPPSQPAPTPPVQGETPDVGATAPMSGLTAQQATTEAHRTPEAQAVTQPRPLAEAPQLSEADQQAVTRYVQSTAALRDSNAALGAALDEQQTRDLASTNPRRLQRALARTTEIDAVNRENAGLNRELGQIVADGQGALNQAAESARSAEQQVSSAQAERNNAARDIQRYQQWEAQWNAWRARGGHTYDAPGNPPISLEQCQFLQARLPQLDQRIATLTAHAQRYRQNADRSSENVALRATSSTLTPATTTTAGQVVQQSNVIAAGDQNAARVLDAYDAALRAAQNPALPASTRQQLQRTVRDVQGNRAEAANWNVEYEQRTLPLRTHNAMMRRRLDIQPDGSVGPRGTVRNGSPDGRLAPDHEVGTGQEADAVHEAGVAGSARVQGAVLDAQRATMTYVRAVTANGANASAEERARAGSLVTATLRSTVSAGQTISPYNPEAGLRFVARAYVAAGGQLARPPDQTGEGAVLSDPTTFTTGRPPVAIGTLPPELRLTNDNPLIAGHTPRPSWADEGQRQVLGDARAAMIPVYMAAQNRRYQPANPGDPSYQDPSLAGTGWGGTGFPGAASDPLADTVPTPDVRTAGDVYSLLAAMASGYGPNAPETAELRTFVQRHEEAMDRMPAIFRNRAQAIENQLRIVNAAFAELRTQGRDAVNANTFTLTRQMQILGGVLGVDVTQTGEQWAMDNDLESLQLRYQALAQRWIEQNRALAAEYENAGSVERVNLNAAMTALNQPRGYTRDSDQTLESIVPRVVTQPSNVIYTFDRQNRRDPFLERTYAAGPIAVARDAAGQPVVAINTSRGSVTQSDFRYSTVVTAAQQEGQNTVDAERNRVAMFIPISESTRRTWIGRYILQPALSMSTWNAITEFAEIELLTFGIGGAFSMGARIAGRGIAMEMEGAALAARGARLFEVSSNVGEIGFTAGGRMARYFGAAEGGFVARTLPRVGRFVAGSGASMVEMQVINFMQEQAEAGIAELARSHHWSPRWAELAQLVVHLGGQAAVNHAQMRASGAPAGPLTERIMHGLPFVVAPAATSVIVREYVLGPRAPGQPISEAEQRRLDHQQERWGFITGVALPALIGGVRREAGGIMAERDQTRRSTEAVMREALPQDATPAQRAQLQTQVRDILRPAYGIVGETPTASSQHAAAQHIETAIANSHLPEPAQRALRQQAQSLRRQAAMAEIGGTHPPPPRAEATPERMREYQETLRRELEANTHGFAEMGPLESAARRQNAIGADGLPTEPRARAEAEGRRRQLDAALEDMLFDAALRDLPPFDPSTIRDPNELQRLNEQRISDIRDRLVRTGIEPFTDPVIAESRAVAMLEASVAQRIAEMRGHGSSWFRQGDRSARLANLEAEQATLEARHRTLAPRVQMHEAVNASDSTVPAAARRDVIAGLDALQARQPPLEGAAYWRAYRDVLAPHMTADAAQAFALRHAYRDTVSMEIARAFADPANRGQPLPELQRAAEERARRALEQLGFDRPLIAREVDAITGRSSQPVREVSRDPSSREATRETAAVTPVQEPAPLRVDAFANDPASARRYQAALDEAARRSNGMDDPTGRVLSNLHDVQSPELARAALDTILRMGDHAPPELARALRDRRLSSADPRARAAAEAQLRAAVDAANTRNTADGRAAVGEFTAGDPQARTAARRRAAAANQPQPDAPIALAGRQPRPYEQHTNYGGEGGGLSAHTVDPTTGVETYRVDTGDSVIRVLQPGEQVVLGSTDYSSCAGFTMCGRDAQGRRVVLLGHAMEADSAGQFTRMREDVARLQAMGVTDIEIIASIDPNARSPRPDGDTGRFHTFPTDAELPAALGAPPTNDRGGPAANLDGVRSIRVVEAPRDERRAAHRHIVVTAEGMTIAYGQSPATATSHDHFSFQPRADGMPQAPRQGAGDPAPIVSDRGVNAAIDGDGTRWQIVEENGRRVFRTYDSDSGEYVTLQPDSPRARELGPWRAEEETRTRSGAVERPPDDPTVGRREEPADVAPAETGRQQRVASSSDLSGRFHESSGTFTAEPGHPLYDPAHPNDHYITVRRNGDIPGDFNHEADIYGNLTSDPNVRAQAERLGFRFGTPPAFNDGAPIVTYPSIETLNRRLGEAGYNFRFFDASGVETPESMLRHLGANPPEFPLAMSGAREDGQSDHIHDLGAHLVGYLRIGHPDPAVAGPALRDMQNTARMYLRLLEHLPADSPLRRELLIADSAHATGDRGFIDQFVSYYDGGTGSISIENRRAGWGAQATNDAQRHLAREMSPQANLERLVERIVNTEVDSPEHRAFVEAWGEEAVTAIHDRIDPLLTQRDRLPATDPRRARLSEQISRELAAISEGIVARTRDHVPPSSPETLPAAPARSEAQPTERNPAAERTEAPAAETAPAHAPARIEAGQTQTWLRSEAARGATEVVVDGVRYRLVRDADGQPTHATRLRADGTTATIALDTLLQSAADADIRFHDEHGAVIAERPPERAASTEPYDPNAIDTSTRDIIEGIRPLIPIGIAPGMMRSMFAEARRRLQEGSVDTAARRAARAEVDRLEEQYYRTTIERSYGSRLDGFIAELPAANRRAAREAIDEILLSHRDGTTESGFRTDTRTLRRELEARLRALGVEGDAAAEVARRTTLEVLGADFLAGPTTGWSSGNVPDGMGPILEQATRALTDRSRVLDFMATLWRDVDGELARLPTDAPQRDRQALLRVLMRRLGIQPGDAATRPGTATRILNEAEFTTLLRERGYFFDATFDGGQHGMDTHLVHMLFLQDTIGPELARRQQPPRNMREMVRWISDNNGTAQRPIWRQLFDRAPPGVGVMDDVQDARSPENLGRVLIGSILDPVETMAIGERRTQARARRTERRIEAETPATTERLRQPLGDRAPEAAAALTRSGSNAGSRLRAGDRDGFMTEATALLTTRYGLSQETAAALAQATFDGVHTRPPSPPNEFFTVLGVRDGATQRRVAQALDALEVRRARGEISDPAAFLREYRRTLEQFSQNRAAIDALVTRRADQLQTGPRADGESSTLQSNANNPVLRFFAFAPLDRVPGFETALAQLPPETAQRIGREFQAAYERLRRTDPQGAEDLLLSTSHLIMETVVAARETRAGEPRMTPEQIGGLLERFNRLGLERVDDLKLLRRLSLHRHAPAGAAPDVVARYDAYNRWVDQALTTLDGVRLTDPAARPALLQTLARVRDAVYASEERMGANRPLPLPEIGELRTILEGVASLPVAEARRVAAVLESGSDTYAMLPLLHGFSRALATPAQRADALRTLETVALFGGTESPTARRVRLELVRALLPDLSGTATASSTHRPPDAATLRATLERVISETVTRERATLAADEAAHTRGGSTEPSVRQRETEILQQRRADLARREAELGVVPGSTPPRVQADLAPIQARAAALARIFGTPTLTPLTPELRALASRAPELLDAMLPGIETVGASLLPPNELAAALSLYASLPPAERAEMLAFLRSIRDPNARVIAMRLLTDSYLRRAMPDDTSPAARQAGAHPEMGPLWQEAHLHHPRVAEAITEARTRMQTPDALAHARAELEAAPLQTQRAANRTSLPPTSSEGHEVAMVTGGTDEARNTRAITGGRQYAIEHMAELGAFLRGTPQARQRLFEFFRLEIWRQEQARMLNGGADPLSHARIEELARLATESALEIALADRVNVGGVTLVIPQGVDPALARAAVAELEAMLRATGADLSLRRQLVLVSPRGVSETSQMMRDRPGGEQGFMNDTRTLGGAVNNFGVVTLEGRPPMNDADRGEPPLRVFIHEMVHMLDLGGHLQVPASVPGGGVSLQTWLTRFLANESARQAPSLYGRDQTAEFMAELIADYMLDPAAVERRYADYPADRNPYAVLRALFPHPPATPAAVEAYFSAHPNTRLGAHATGQIAATQTVRTGSGQPSIALVPATPATVVTSGGEMTPTTRRPGGDLAHLDDRVMSLTGVTLEPHQIPAGARTPATQIYVARVTQRRPTPSGPATSERTVVIRRLPADPAERARILGTAREPNRHVTDIVDLGDGRWGYVMDAEEATTVDPPRHQNSDGLIRRLHQAVLDLDTRHRTYDPPLRYVVANDGTVFIPDEFTRQAADNEHPDAVSFAEPLRRRTYGEPIATEPQPAADVLRQLDANAPALARFTPEQRNRLREALQNVPADARVDVAYDAVGGRMWVRERRSVHPNGSQWTTRGFESEGAPISQPDFTAWPTRPIALTDGRAVERASVQDARRFLATPEGQAAFTPSQREALVRVLSELPTGSEVRLSAARAGGEELVGVTVFANGRQSDYVIRERVGTSRPPDGATFDAWPAQSFPGGAEYVSVQSALTFLQSAEATAMSPAQRRELAARIASLPASAEVRVGAGANGSLGLTIRDRASGTVLDRLVFDAPVGMIHTDFAAGEFSSGHGYARGAPGRPIVYTEVFDASGERVEVRIPTANGEARFRTPPEVERLPLEQRPRGLLATENADFATLAQLHQTRLGEIVGHFKAGDVSAVMRELTGSVIPDNSGGRFWNHLSEHVRDMRMPLEAYRQVLDAALRGDQTALRRIVAEAAGAPNLRITDEMLDAARAGDFTRLKALLTAAGVRDLPNEFPARRRQQMTEAAVLLRAVERGISEPMRARLEAWRSRLDELEAQAEIVWPSARVQSAPETVPFRFNDNDFIATPQAAGPFEGALRGLGLDDATLRRQRTRYASDIEPRLRAATDPATFVALIRDFLMDSARQRNGGAAPNAEATILAETMLLLTDAAERLVAQSSTPPDQRTAEVQRILSGWYATSGMMPRIRESVNRAAAATAPAIDPAVAEQRAFRGFESLAEELRQPGINRAGVEAFSDVLLEGAALGRLGSPPNTWATIVRRFSALSPADAVALQNRLAGITTATERTQALLDSIGAIGSSAPAVAQFEAAPVFGVQPFTSAQREQRRLDGGDGLLRVEGGLADTRRMPGQRATFSVDESGAAYASLNPGRLEPPSVILPNAAARGVMRVENGVVREIRINAGEDGDAANRAVARMLRTLERQGLRLTDTVVWLADGTASNAAALQRRFGGE